MVWWSITFSREAWICWCGPLGSDLQIDYGVLVKSIPLSFGKLTYVTLLNVWNNVKHYSRVIPTGPLLNDYWNENPKRTKLRHTKIYKRTINTKIHQYIFCCFFAPTSVSREPKALEVPIGNEEPNMPGGVLNIYKFHK